MIAATLTSQVVGKSDERLRVAAGLIASAVALAIAIVIAAAIGTSILGVPTQYRDGVDSRLGAQVARDFLADQDAEGSALSSSDPSALNGRLTGSALVDVTQQISNQSTSGSAPTVSFQAASLTVLRAADPSDASLVLELQEDGTKTVVTSGGANAAPTEQNLSFHGNFWLRLDTGGRYLIADQSIQNQPASILPAVFVIAAALVVVGLAYLLFVGQRRRPTAAVSAPAPVSVVTAAPLSDLPPASAILTTSAPPGIVIRTFGGLRIEQGERDWAAALTSRSVTGFVWLRLLVAAIQAPSARLARDDIARQASPGVSREVQLKRLRNVIAKGLREMPEPLRERIAVEPEAMSFRLDGCSIDALDLLAASREFEHTSALSSAQADRLEIILRNSQGIFLPEFDVVEDLATDHHPTCTALIKELREQLVDKRVGLGLLLADVYLSSGRASQAIGILEPARADRPDREDVADRLSAAYRAAGRDAEADRLSAKKA